MRLLVFGGAIRYSSRQARHVTRSTPDTSCTAGAAVEVRRLGGRNANPATDISEVVGQVDVAVSIEQRKQIQCAKGLLSIGVERSAHEREVRCSGEGIG